MSITLTRAERETVITRASDEEIWHISTADPVVINQCVKRKYVEVTGKPTPYRFFDVPRRCVRFGSLQKRAGGSFKKPNKPETARTDAEIQESMTQNASG